MYSLRWKKRRRKERSREGKLGEGKREEGRGEIRGKIGGWGVADGEGEVGEIGVGEVGGKVKGGGGGVCGKNEIRHRCF